MAKSAEFIDRKINFKGKAFLRFGIGGKWLISSPEDGFDEKQWNFIAEFINKFENGECTQELVLRNLYG